MFQVTFDDERIVNHPETTLEIKECCKDIKVLNRKDLRSIMSWAKSLKKQLFKEEKQTEDTKPDQTNSEEIEVSEDEKELQDIDKKIGSLEVPFIKKNIVYSFFFSNNLFLFEKMNL